MPCVNNNPYLILPYVNLDIIVRNDTLAAWLAMPSCPKGENFLTQSVIEQFLLLFLLKYGGRVIAPLISGSDGPGMYNRI